MKMPKFFAFGILIWKVFFLEAKLQWVSFKNQEKYFIDTNLIV